MYDTPELLQRLRRRFGSGLPGSPREAFYLKLAKAVELHGDAAYMIVAGAASDAAGKTRQDRYFCKVAKLRLQEAGMMMARDSVQVDDL